MKKSRLVFLLFVLGGIIAPSLVQSADHAVGVNINRVTSDPVELGVGRRVHPCPPEPKSLPVTDGPNWVVRFKTYVIPDSISVETNHNLFEYDIEWYDHNLGTGKATHYPRECPLSLAMELAVKHFALTDIIILRNDFTLKRLGANWTGDEAGLRKVIDVYIRAYDKRQGVTVTFLDTVKVEPCYSRAYTGINTIVTGEASYASFGFGRAPEVQVVSDSQAKACRVTRPIDW
ncbi:MAG TPA: hypothetical protein VEA59_00450 [Patescibacteria group bacterium]|nr:hypothetical protein [Patescibacteria group bacterium]